MREDLPTGEGTEEKTATLLYEVGGIRFGEFTLTSGKTSPYYVDLRIVPSHPDLFEKFTDICVAILKGEVEDEVDRIAGVPTGGLPFATLVAYKAGYPLIYTRKRKKSHGRKKAVEGVLEDGDEVVLVDDITTTGGSIRDAAEMIRGEEGSVHHAIVMIDREEGAEENLREEEITLHTGLKISEIVRHLRNASVLDEGKYSLIMNYLKGSQRID